MKKIMIVLATLSVLGVSPAMAADMTPDDDVKAYREYFEKRFPGVELNEFGNGVYAIDEVQRANWEAIEEFPPYEPMIDDGEAMWNALFANGKSYADCFGDDPAIAGKYPHWDKQRKEVITLALAVNDCRKANGEEPLKYKKGPIASLLAYIAFKSRGQVTNVEVPMDDPDAVKAYNEGKSFYFARRGQLNFSCAHCHFESAGFNIRADKLSPALGHTTNWPVYRSKWGELGTLHRRFSGCNEQVRAKAFKAQGKEYRNLEYFLTHMSNGVELNGPSARK